MQPDLLYKIALSHIPLVGQATAKLLVSYCGGVKNVFEASRKQLLQIPGIGPKVAENVLSKTALLEAEQEIFHLEKQGIRPIFFLDDDYPNRLKQIPDCPTMLYFKGSDEKILSAERVVAIVGTRKPTIYGKAVCEEIVEGLKAYNCLIISGLAFGIDVTAHKACLLFDLPTVGVLGHGLGRIYPEQHFETAQKMLENGGLLTEFSFHTGPDRQHFPMRNRIIAGLADALLVVETASSGGSMISAVLANDYDREVFAVPGRTKDLVSAGCNLLIKTNRAALVETADDLATALSWDEKSAKRSRQIALPLDFSAAETTVFEKIKSHSQIGIDELVWSSGLPNSEVVNILLNLEFKGFIRTLPGKRYMII